MSTAQKCWRKNRRSTSWPEVVQQDPDCEGVSIFLAGYKAGRSASRAAASDAAAAVYTALADRTVQKVIRVRDQKTSNQAISVMDKPRILFVAHSLGGIIVRRILCRERAVFGNKRVGLLLVASPSYGSGLANIIGGIPFLSWKLAKGLARSSQELIDLDNDFKRLLEDQEIPALRGQNLIESQAPFFLGWLKRVVDTESASRYFGSEVVPATNHNTIQNPSSPHDQVHRKLRQSAQKWGLMTRQCFVDHLKELRLALDEQSRAFSGSVPVAEETKQEVFLRVRSAAIGTASEADAPDWLENSGIDSLISGQFRGNLDRPYHDLTAEDIAATSKALDRLWNELGPYHA
jgi:hypothetical protein